VTLRVRASDHGNSPTDDDDEDDDEHE